MKLQFLSSICDRLNALVSKSYTGHVVITVKLHQGGVRQVIINEEYPVDLIKTQDEKSLDIMQKV